MGGTGALYLLLVEVPHDGVGVRELHGFQRVLATLGVVQPLAEALVVVPVVPKLLNLLLQVPQPVWMGTHR